MGEGSEIAPFETFARTNQLFIDTRKGCRRLK
jgi:hypothetical protein